jgi:signal transduction histidine kinase
MTAPWITRAPRWALRAGQGLARSVILLVLCLLYPAIWALAASLIRTVLTHPGNPAVGAGPVNTGVSLVFIASVSVVVPSSPICHLLRRLVRRWTGTAITNGYRPAAPIVRMATGYWWNGRRYFRSIILSRTNWWVNRQLRDPAAWRDRGALLLGVAGAGVAALPLMAVTAGIVMLAQIHSPARMIGLDFLALGIGGAPYAWRGAVAVLAQLLQPSPAAVLSARVAQLTEQRADTTAIQAAEIRRIERDLHDGAQARLITLGLALTTAERAIDHDPEHAKTLLREASATTTTALRELRELVRGITPPVLNERGLTDALRALALDTPLAVTVHADAGFDTALDTPIESALYFGTAELLTNTVKHANATNATVHLRRHPTAIVIEVTDNGRGNAVPTTTGGLAGLRRRLAVFDGTLTLHSPPGGPTSARMVVPWTSS